MIKISNDFISDTGGMSDEPRCVNACSRLLGNLQNTSKQGYLETPGNFLVWSHPLRAWKLRNTLRKLDQDFYISGVRCIYGQLSQRLYCCLSFQNNAIEHGVMKWDLTS